MSKVHPNSKAKPEIEQAAVASFKLQERKVAERLAKLHEILPVKDDERKCLEEKVRAVDDVTWKDLLIERMDVVIKTPAAAKASTDGTPPPTLRAGTGTKPARGAFSVIEA